MLAKLGLQIGHELAHRLAFFGHHIGQQQRIQQAVALGQVALEADAGLVPCPIVAMNVSRLAAARGAAGRSRVRR